MCSAIRQKRLAKEGATALPCGSVRTFHGRDGRAQAEISQPGKHFDVVVEASPLKLVPSDLASGVLADQSPSWIRFHRAGPIAYPRISLSDRAWIFCNRACGPSAIEAAKSERRAASSLTEPL